MHCELTEFKLGPSKHVSESSTLCIYCGNNTY